jgi:hypothetical protein
VCVQILAEKREELLEQERCRDHGRAGVEAKSVVLHNASASAQLIETVEEGYLVAQGTGTKCRGNATEPTADDDQVPCGRRRGLEFRNH